MQILNARRGLWWRSALGCMGLSLAGSTSPCISLPVSERSTVPVASAAQVEPETVGLVDERHSTNGNTRWNPDIGLKHKRAN